MTIQKDESVDEVRTPIDPMKPDADWANYRMLYRERVPMASRWPTGISVEAIRICRKAGEARWGNLRMEELAERAGVPNVVYLKLFLRVALPDDEISQAVTKRIYDALGLSLEVMESLPSWNQA